MQDAQPGDVAVLMRDNWNTQKWAGEIIYPGGALQIWALLNLDEKEANNKVALGKMWKNTVACLQWKQQIMLREQAAKAKTVDVIWHMASTWKQAETEMESRG